MGRIFLLPFRRSPPCDLPASVVYWKCLKMYPPTDSQHRQGVSLHGENRVASPRVSVARNQNMKKGSTGFTLVELLVVIAIMILMITLTVPAFNALNGAGDLGKAASDIQGFLEQARNQALVRNTFVYVGLQEMDGLSGTNTGIGEVVIAAIGSADGTRLTGAGVLTTNLIPIGKAITFSNVHITNASQLLSGGMTNRPGQSGYANNPNLSIIDLSTNGGTTVFQWPPLPAPKRYAFYNLIEFDPQGIPRIYSTTPNNSVQNYLEIPLIQAHGDVVVTKSPNQAAIQIDGVTGAVRVYRP